MEITVILGRSIAVSVLSAAALVATAGASAAAAAPTADSSCSFARTLCTWDQQSYQGTRFTTQAANPTVGTCVNLAAHGWGDGRVKSARNTASMPAHLYSNQDCTGTSYAIMPAASYPSITFASQSVYVY
ncbi:peptidase inhibitor family I36 protein [Micromonospora echinofusca]|uniref:peptidase inhibitor family I36 protein n=1 Tax=Micromonospora echinofusca TaxID=47858 RepID=UPI00343AC555